MFGEIILIGGVSLIVGGTSRLLEDIGKEKAARTLDVCFHIGMGVYAIRFINKLFDEVTEFL